uniref:Uncharacterized protein n=1 Tax=Grammatophora oceanica TaxID=210454 RepID=A0A7S1VBU9_9STRA|mmetsp:Transcript_42285/g.62705  ORF Transcript_42285/g.62705 Transcript_42285/m.62705 type:complete len:106 (+) Transcript_42285:450-767(+)
MCEYAVSKKRMAARKVLCGCGRSKISFTTKEQRRHPLADEARKKEDGTSASSDKNLPTTQMEYLTSTLSNKVANMTQNSLKKWSVSRGGDNKVLSNQVLASLEGI